MIYHKKHGHHHHSPPPGLPVHHVPIQHVPIPVAAAPAAPVYDEGAEEDASYTNYWFRNEDITKSELL